MAVMIEERLEPLNAVHEALRLLAQCKSLEEPAYEAFTLLRESLWQASILGKANHLPPIEIQMGDAPDIDAADIDRRMRGRLAQLDRA